MISKRLDPDIIILLGLPFFLGGGFLFLPYESWGAFSGLILGLFVYEMLTFHKRWVFGFTGLNIVSMPAVILLSYTTLIAMPSIYICAIKDHPAVDTYYIAVMSFYYLYPLGLLFAEKIWPLDMAKAKKLRQTDLSADPLDPLLGEFLYFLLLVGIAITALYIFRVKVIPLFELITNPGEAIKFSILRDEAFKFLEVTFAERYLILWQRATIMPVGMVISLFLYLVYRKKQYLWFLGIFFFLGLFFNSLTLEKSPTAAVFLILLAFFYLRKKTFSFKFVLFSFVLVMLLPVAIVYFKFFVDHDDIATYILISMSNRIFVIPSEALYLHFEMFPRFHEFLYGRSSQLFSWLHHEGGVMLPSIVAGYWYKNPHSTVYANAIYIGNFWADFGMIGVFTSTFFIGIIIHWLNQVTLKVARYRKNIVYMLLTSVVVPIFTIKFLSANFTTLFFSSGLIVLVVFLIFLDKFFYKWIKQE